MPDGMVGEAGLEPAWLAPRDFKSLVYTNFTTRPVRVARFRDRASLQLATAACLEAGVGIEPAYTALQAAA